MTEYPKLRPLNLRWTQYEGKEVLVLQDPLRMTENSLVVPRPLTPFLALLDGLRDNEEIAAGFLLRTGVPIPPDQVASFVQTLDDALLLENQRFFSSKQQALENYRAGPFRTLALAPGSYSNDPAELRRVFDEYCREAQADDPQEKHQDIDGIVGLISPHIDFAKGWKTYARAWQPVRKAVEDADLVILLGTDHNGASGSLTLTRQSYATPWGVLPTDLELVDKLVDILGEERAFTEEVNHIGEHSIELASVWLHYMAGEKPKKVLPVLCGHHEAALASTVGVEIDMDFRPLWDALALLAEVAYEPRVLVVAAADVSHIGPAFGDDAPIDDEGKSGVHSTDRQWLEAACSGSGDLLAKHILQNGDPTRICGMAPIHHMVTLLEGSTGKLLDYDQCPADEDFGSLVSIAGAVFTR